MTKDLGQAAVPLALGPWPSRRYFVTTTDPENVFTISTALPSP